MKSALITGAVLAVVIPAAVLASRQGRDDAAPTAAAPAQSGPARGADTTGPRRSDELLRQIGDVDREVGEFGENLPRCSALVQAVELADASDCIERAYAGVDETVRRTVAAIEDLEAGVGATCRDALRGYVRRLRRFHEWTEATTQAGRNRQFGEFNARAVKSSRQTRRYERARARVAACD